MPLILKSFQQSFEMDSGMKKVVLSHLKDFKILQEERVKQYHLWEEDYKRYLATGPNYDFEMYKRCVKETTDNFQKASEAIMQVISAVKTLEGQEATELAEIIQKVSNRIAFLNSLN